MGNKRILLILPLAIVLILAIGGFFYYNQVQSRNNISPSWQPVATDTPTNQEKAPEHPYLKIVSSEFGGNFTASYPVFFTIGRESPTFTQEVLDDLSGAVERFVQETGSQSPNNPVSLKYVAWEMADEHLLSIVFEKKETVDNKPISTLVSMHYDSKTGTYFQLADIFKQGIAEKLSEIFNDPTTKLIRNQDKAISGSAFSKNDLFNQSTSPDIENFSNFVLGESTITFYFAPGQTAEASSGITFSMIHYNQLKDLFQDNFKQLYEKQYNYPMQ